MPRVAPVTRTVLPAIVIALLPSGCGFRAARLAATNTDQADPAKSPRARWWLAAVSGRPGRRPGSGDTRPRRGGGRRLGRGAVLRWQAEQGEQARVREG